MQDGRTPLAGAASEGHARVAKVLLAAGVNNGDPDKVCVFTGVCPCPCVHAYGLRACVVVQQVAAVNDNFSQSPWVYCNRAVCISVQRCHLMAVAQHGQMVYFVVASIQGHEGVVKAQLAAAVDKQTPDKVLVASTMCDALASMCMPGHQSSPPPPSLILYPSASAPKQLKIIEKS